MRNPSISVVIPAHNAAAFVRKAVESALAQTYPAAEIVVVDDASTDGTSDCVAAYDNPVRLLQMPQNVERGGARNRGAAAARGDVLAFLDADDEWEPDKLARQVGALNRGHACVTGARVVTATGTLVSELIPPADVAARLWRENPRTGGGSSLALPRDLFHRAGGFQEARPLQGSEDWVFLAQILLAGGEIEAVREPLIRYRVHGSNSTGSPDNVARSTWAAVSWFERSGFVSGRTATRQRAVIANLIARQYAARRRWHPAARWTLTALRAGAPLTAVPGLAATAASGLKQGLSPR